MTNKAKEVAHRLHILSIDCVESVDLTEAANTALMRQALEADLMAFANLVKSYESNLRSRANIESLKLAALQK